MADDPYDDLEYDQPSLSEQVAPYQQYGDAELAVALLEFQKQHSVPGLNESVRVGAPAASGATFECQHCNVNVRGVATPIGPQSALSLLWGTARDAHARERPPVRHSPRSPLYGIVEESSVGLYPPCLGERVCLRKN